MKLTLEIIALTIGLVTVLTWSVKGEKGEVKLEATSLFARLLFDKPGELTENPNIEAPKEKNDLTD